MKNPVGSIEILEVETLKSKKTGNDYKVAKCIQTSANKINVGKIFVRENMPVTEGIYMPTFEQVERDGWLTQVLVELNPINTRPAASVAAPAKQV